jgi:hypothetical protein
VLKVAPKDAAAWSNRGNVQLALGDPLAAIADQDHSLLLEPDNADPHLNRGTAEEALGRWDAAAADYSWILERDPADASALYNLGNVEGSLGHWQAARERFDAAEKTRTPPDMVKWKEQCEKYIGEIGGLGAGYPLHVWEDPFKKPEPPPTEPIAPGTSTPGASTPEGTPPTSTTPAPTPPSPPATPANSDASNKK